MIAVSAAQSPVRPAQLVERRIISSILDGTFPPGTPLPGERQLAETIGVARPLLRETLHRLAGEGWLTIAHGKPTMVNDYWAQGGMGLLSTLAKHIGALPPGFVTHLMNFRSRLLPIIAGLAVKRAPQELLAYLKARRGLDDDIDRFVDFDWRLQLVMAAKTGNPIYRLIFNDFATLFASLAKAYFALPEARVASRNYYRDLEAAIQSGSRRVEMVVEDAMNHSVAIWQRVASD